MKYLFICILLAASFGLSAQLRLEMGFGATTQGYAAAGVAGLYQYQLGFVQAGYMTGLTRDVRSGTYLNVTGGLHLYVTDVLFLEPSAGYASIRRSNERKDLNDRGLLVAGAVGRDVGDGSMLIKTAYSKGVATILFVIRYNF